MCDDCGVSAKLYQASSTDRLCAHCFDLSKRCSGCGHVSSAAMRKCGQCRMACYCNQACQTSHWSAHKLLCAPGVSALPKFKHSIPYYGVLDKGEHHREAFTAAIRETVLAQHGKVPFCHICGDTEDLGRVMAIGKVFCKDCHRIQLDM